MKALFIIVVYAVFTTLNAKTIIVDNNVPSAGDFSNLQAAHDAADNGDFIYVIPSMKSYGGITVTKKLNIFGVGFELLRTLGEPFTLTTKISGEMIFESGANWSKLDGFDGLFNVTVKCSHVTIKRNYIDHIYIYSEANAIVQNKISSSSFAITIKSSTASNQLIQNNIIIGSHGIVATMDKLGNLTINRNVIHGKYYSFYNIDESLIKNNIIIDGNYYLCDNNTILHNICNSNQFPSSNSNLINVDMNSVFVNWKEEDFHLLPNSPARGAGENGTDMGIYGGDAPFVDGGFPELPSILQLVVPTVGSKKGGLEIKFKAKSNN